MRKIEAKIVADSVDSRGNRITSYLLTYPRFIHAEVMTHRMFSRNAASSRAIPLSKMLKSVVDDPFIPIAFQKKHSGMQGTEYIEDEQGIKVARAAWSMGADSATAVVQAMDMLNITKQLCNRLLEPYLWYTVLVTATEYDNFFELRCPKYEDDHGQIYFSKKDFIEKGSNDEDSSKWTDLQWLGFSNSGAEIHIQALAEAMWDAKNESTPNQLEAGDWHIPFGDKIDAENYVNSNIEDFTNGMGILRNAEILRKKVAIARCARLSYMTFDGEIDYAKDVELHDSLLKSKHASPFEHVAKCMNDTEYHELFQKTTPQKGDHKDYFVNHDPGWCNNIRGFIQYRFLIENK